MMLFCLHACANIDFYTSRLSLPRVHVNTVGFISFPALVDPAVIRFTHARISPVFTGCGLPLTQTLDDIIAGRCTVHNMWPLQAVMSFRTKISDLPLITVIPIGDNDYCRCVW